jgi:hypothetical protein
MGTQGESCLNVIAIIGPYICPSLTYANVGVEVQPSLNQVDVQRRLSVLLPVPRFVENKIGHQS